MNRAVEAVRGRNEQTPELIELYRRMLLIREAEKSCGALFAEGAIPGFIHLSDGQEAVSVGVMASLRTDDTIASTHRGHGHALAKGLSLDGFFRELMGKADGACKGRGGSMHVADLSVGMLGANGIVGGGIAIAVGSGLAQKLRGGDGVAVSFFGDGALAEGVIHECLNIAALKGIPMIFACENNGWSEFSPTSTQIIFTLEKLAVAYGIEYHGIDGTKVEGVAALAAEAIATVRRESRPIVLEFFTTRVRGHYEGDAQRYRTDAADAIDPLAVTRALLEERGASGSELDDLAETIRAEVLAAVEAARLSEEPTLQSAAEEVYAAEIAR
ncbi:thiamine pyrophosphate-dependent dehydrogenase E1 component subunit alpha [Sphingosinicella sp.]|uniref:thiamine pyrophosphate-dependent dehydrogenase E1 component subunit alpha n=1 Tax=Sphingosinicella sp. TaxID=1917971 RepID=UPI0035B397BE